MFDRLSDTELLAAEKAARMKVWYARKDSWAYHSRSWMALHDEVISRGLSASTSDPGFRPSNKSGDSVS